MSDVSVETAEIAIKTCVKLMETDDFKESVRSVLEDIRSVADALCCMIILVDHEAETAVKYCESLRAGSKFEDIELEEVIPYELVQTWDDMIDESNVVIIRNDRDLEYIERKNPMWAESLRSSGIHSLIFIPLYQNRKIIGYIHLANYDVARVVRLKEVMELLSLFLGTEISNNILHERMESVLHTDELTGVNNRKEMLKRMGEVNGRAFGVISMDLNCLKRVNDYQGHDTGDAMLVQAAEVLKKIFYNEDIFRTGGDEFIVIMPGIKESVFERKLARLKRDAEKNVDVSFAIGSFWSDGSIMAAEALKIADDNMYEDKREFYIANPELKIR